MMKIAEDDQGTTLDTPMILNSTVSVQFVEEKFMRMLNTTSRFGENVEVTTLGVGEVICNSETEYLNRYLEKA